MVTEGASVTNNDGCEAVKNARDNHIKWEEENGFDPTEDWGNNKPNITFGLGEENKAYAKYNGPNYRSRGRIKIFEVNCYGKRK